MSACVPLVQSELSAQDNVTFSPTNRFSNNKQGEEPELREEPASDLNIMESDPVYLSVVKSTQQQVLSDIYHPQVGMVVWQRPLDEAFEYAQSLMSQAPQFSFKGQQTPQLAAKLLEKLLPEAKGKQAFIEDVTLLMEMFACLFDLQEVGLRLDVLSKAMCPRFHVDKIPCRLITTYAGAGSEWLHEAHVQRGRLGRGGDAKDHNSGLLHQGRINRLNVGDVALMKGDDWPASQGRGMVHRSPSASSEQPRLFLSLDMV